MRGAFVLLSAFAAVTALPLADHAATHHLQTTSISAADVDDRIEHVHAQQSEEWNRADLVLLLDGSSSLGGQGWAAEKKLAENVVKGLSNLACDVQVAVQQFSGPSSWHNWCVPLAARSNYMSRVSCPAHHPSPAPAPRFSLVRLLAPRLQVSLPARSAPG